MSGLYLKRLRAKLFRLHVFLVATRGDALLNKIISIGIGLFVAGILVAQGINMIVTANTTGWPTGVGTIFSVLLPVMGVVALILVMAKRR